MPPAHWRTSTPSSPRRPSILYPPPLSPIGVHWSPLESTGFQWTPSAFISFSTVWCSSVVFYDSLLQILKSCSKFKAFLHFRTIYTRLLACHSSTVFIQSSFSSSSSLSPSSSPLSLFFFLSFACFLFCFSITYFV